MKGSMQINNPLQMNDWEIKKFFRVIFAIQVAVWGVIGLDVTGIQILILRQFIGFIYLTFIPGIILLRILKLHKLGNIETLLYTVGLSIAILMFTGLFMNTVYPLFGISEPISFVPVIITISVVVLMLCVLCYICDKGFSDPAYIGVGDILSPPALFLCTVPFLAIFGTHLVNFYHNNILLMFLIVMLALIALLIAFDKFIPKKLYPLAVFVIAISLLYHSSLISTYLWGWDIHQEYWLSNLVMTSSYWDSTIPGMANAMLSIVLLAPIFSSICDMSLTWVLKIIYPLIFSLVPLGLYRAFQKQTDVKIAFFSCFFFMSIFTFYTEMLALARQQIAELFLVLLILLMVNKNMNTIKKSFLFIVFGFSLAVSHYGLSYTYMFCLIATWLILVLAKAKNRTISSTFVLIFSIFTVSWYIYVSSSSTFNAIVHISDHIARSIFTDFLNPEAAQGMAIILSEVVSPLHRVTKYLHLTVQFFIAVGILTLLLKGSKNKFEKEYVAFSLVNFGIVLAAIAVPFFASALNTSRLYQITLIFLAPFCVIGGITVFKVMCWIVRASGTDERVGISLKAVSVFLVIFLLFNTGFVYEVTKDTPSSFSLSSYIDSVCYNEKEALGAKWLSDHSDLGSIVYSDPYSKLLLNDWFHLESTKLDRKNYRLPSGTKRLGDYPFIPRAYIYLRSYNIEKQKLLFVPGCGITKRVNFEDVPGLLDMISRKNKVYDNVGSQIYAPGWN